MTKHNKDIDKLKSPDIRKIFINDTKILYKNNKIAYKSEKQSP